MRSNFCLAAVLMAALSITHRALADQELLQAHCAKCHSGKKPKGDFQLSSLGNSPDKKNADLWITALDYVKAEEMPPADKSQLSDGDRMRLVRFFGQQIGNYHEQADSSLRVQPRRLNNRELANSISDVLLIEDVGTHQPLANLLGDTLQDGFDTNGEALGMSQFHLEQYIGAMRNVLDATILSGKRPKHRRYQVLSSDINMTSLSQNSKRNRTKRNSDSVDFLDPRLRAYFSNFRTAPATGRYQIIIRATGKDRGVYDSDETGIYDGDPIPLRVHLGDRVYTYDLPDNGILEIELDEWIAAGTRLELSYPTDGLRFRGNGNFKFQYSIAHDYIKANDPERYAKVVEKELATAPARTAKNVKHWSHWTEEWQGPRPRLFGASVEGPIYDSWPPKRQVALLGRNPSVDNAASILQPIAERAWRRQVQEGELDPIVDLVESRVEVLGDIEALKEGIVAILVSPSFLLINSEEGEAADRFATKLSYFLKSTTPSARLRKMVARGELNSYETVRAEVQRQFDQNETAEFLNEFPHAWMQLDRINFMAPDPDRYPLYDRKRVSDDMVKEVLWFFRHMVDNNRPVPEFLSADYSFVNADLAKVYGLDDVPQDSKLRMYKFANGRRGGLLGMGAFLTLTADSLATSPIHRAIYVMENFMGIHPAPPPANVKIAEPDVRQAKTIKEILAAHRADSTCASCHQSIDPYGYAFENFDPMGAWRDQYTEQIAPKPTRQELLEIRKQDKKRAAEGLPPIAKPWENKPIPIDASAKFRNGTEYRDIIEYRRHLLSDANRDRFVRCFITKLLTYANGAEPEYYSEVEKILSTSAENEYRIVDTIAAVVHSPLFREE